MEKQERDSKGRFLPGNTEGRNSPINNGLATEMQARSAEARKRNKTIGEMLKAYLSEEAPGSGGHTRGEILVMKAVNNHKDGKLTFKDLRDLSRVIGEDVLNIKTDGPQVIVVSDKAIEAAKKWSK